MPGRTYVLLVGINRYREPSIPTLRGCVADITRFSGWLKGRVAGHVHEIRLVDDEATREGIIGGIRNHLGQAAAGDTAVFYFSGHGSREPVAPEHEHLEPTGLNQTLVCHDSRTDDVADLADKELSILLDEVAGAGAHTLVILDCCHAGGATRSPQGEAGFRSIPPASRARSLSAWLAPRVEPAGPGRFSGGAAPEHVALSACRSFERARETAAPNGEHGAHGLFSDALLAALATLDQADTYRDLIAAVRCRIESLTDVQHPVLYPLYGGGIADQPVLGGRVAARPARFMLQHGPDGWKINAGSLHGLTPAQDGQTTEFAVLQCDGSGTTPVGKVALAELYATWCTVDWFGSPLCTDRQYPVQVSHIPQPRIGVHLCGPEAIVGQLADAIAGSGPAGGAAPYLRLVDEQEASHGLSLAVFGERTEGRVRYRVCDPGSAVGPQVEGHGPQAARRMAAMLEHVARWHMVRNLAHPLSTIAQHLSLEVLECRRAEDGSLLAPAPLAVSATGEIRLAYRYVEGQGWLPPRIRVRVRCSGTAPYPLLYIALLNLTDSYAVGSGLFPGDWIAPGGTASAFAGTDFDVRLPLERAVRPGAQVKDWLKLLIATDAFDVHGLELPRLQDMHGNLRCAPGTGKLALPDDWGALTLPLVTTVPTSTTPT